MPRRTNDFQTLVALIERQLAPSGAGVTESKLLRDRETGEEREVDVVIETCVGVHKTVIGVECTSSRRRADVTWIEKLRGKHQDLPTDKLIAVSRSGFTQAALKKAKGLSISTLTLDEAQRADWRSVVWSLDTITLESFLKPYLTEATVIFPPNTPRSAVDRIQPREMVLYDTVGRCVGPLREYAQSRISDPNVVRAAEERAYTDSGTIIELETPFLKGTHVIDSDGRKWEVEAVQLQAKCRKEVSCIDLEHVRYGPAQVSAGDGATFGRKVKVVAVEQKDKSPTLRLRIHARTEKGESSRRK